METKDKVRSDLGKRIEARLTALGKNQPWLAEKLGVKQPAISQVLSGAIKRPKYMPELAKVLETSIEWLLQGSHSDSDTHHSLHDNVTRLTQNVTKPSQYSGTKAPRDSADGFSTLVPVYGPAAASHPELILLTDDFIVEKMERPKELLRIKEGFVMYIAGDSMRPRYKDSEMVSVNPNMKPRKEQDCVIVLDEEGNALVKEFIGETDTEFKFKQYNPEKTIKIKKSDVRALYAVVGRPV